MTLIFYYLLSHSSSPFLLYSFFLLISLTDPPSPLLPPPFQPRPCSILMIHISHPLPFHLACLHRFRDSYSRSSLTEEIDGLGRWQRQSHHPTPPPPPCVRKQMYVCVRTETERDVHTLSCQPPHICTKTHTHAHQCSGTGMQICTVW